MGRILGIDFGTKRIGMAVTDPLKIFASPLKTVKNLEFDSFLHEYLNTESIEEFVIGYPVKMNNQASEAVKYINPFIRKLEEAISRENPSIWLMKGLLPKWLWKQ